MTFKESLHTVDEAAEILRLTHHTIRAWIAQRRIGVVRLGRAVRVPGSEIERLIAMGKVPARPDLSEVGYGRRS